MRRRLEDRIRELCAKTLVAGGSELDATLVDLKSALHAHTQRLRNMAGMKLVRREDGSPSERRSA